MDANDPLSVIAKNRPTLLVFKVLLLLFNGLCAAACWSVDCGSVKWMFAYLCGCSIASVTFRWGWFVPCVAAGIQIGLFSDNVVKGGSIESQMWETIGRLGCGAVGGIVFGLVLDRLKET